jgi:hypothetical protein
MSAPEHRAEANVTVLGAAVWLGHCPLFKEENHSPSSIRMGTSVASETPSAALSIMVQMRSANRGRAMSEFGGKAEDIHSG